MNATIRCWALIVATTLWLQTVSRMAAAAEPARAAKPNVVLILADDLGWRDLGCYGSTFHQTPALDALARQGMRFTNAYASAAVCSPSRASLLTGKSPARLHLTHIVQAAQATKGGLRDPSWTPYLPLEEVTLAESLQPAGYATGIIGKWHLGGAIGRSANGDGAEGNPLLQGFDFQIGGCVHGQPPDYFYPYTRTIVGNQLVGMTDLAGGRPGEYLTDRLTDEAERFLERNKARPFFLFLSHFAPHTSMGDRLQAPEALIEKFKARVDSQDPQHDPVYAAMLASLDQGVERVVRKLSELGLAENTLVIFTSDNGGYGSKTSNLPLRGAKHTPYEGGLRVPTLVRWPGHIPPGTVSDTPIISADVVPTVVAAAGLEPARESVLDGANLLPALTGSGALVRPSLYWHYPHCDTEPYSVVRQGNLKLIEFLGDGRTELYDLRDDPAEKTNLAERRPEQVVTLRRDLAQWRESVGAQMPERFPAP